ncbi:MAG TPA: GNAT family N-acetyltransferase, partial [Opitutaceae bacterium]|nr:GNAT family N-acetyltransferase [Opitutaceae bacterium]
MTALDFRPMIIEPMQESDWTAVRAIYHEGIDTGNATFTSEPPESWEKWIASHMDIGSLVARNGTGVLGWTALSRVSSRCVYAGVAELSIYVSARARGQGVGTKLLAALIDVSEKADIWTLQAGIFPENTASL